MEKYPTKPLLRGFTVVELLVTIALIFTLSGAAVGAYQQSVEQQRYEADKIRLSGAFELARKLAIANDLSLPDGSTLGCDPTLLTNPTVLGVKIVFTSTSYELMKQCYEKNTYTPTDAPYESAGSAQRVQLYTVRSSARITDRSGNTPAPLVFMNIPNEQYAPLISVYQEDAPSGTLVPLSVNTLRFDYLSHLELRKTRVYATNAFSVTSSGCAGSASTVYVENGYRVGENCKLIKDTPNFRQYTLPTPTPTPSDEPLDVQNGGTP